MTQGGGDMLPIKAWRIVYADGSTFTSRDGTWAEAPPFGVQAVVWYHDPPFRTIRHGTEVYEYEATMADGAEAKIGLWRDEDGYYRLIRRVHDEWKVLP